MPVGRLLVAGAGVLALLAAPPPAPAQESSSRPAAGAERTGLSPAALDAQELRPRLRAILAEPALSRAHAGLHVQVAETGEVLFSRSADRRFVPASNTKLITAAVALHELGPGHRWTTRLVASGPVRDGVLQGDLWVVGGGNPLLTREDVEGFAPRLREAGIRRIAGDVVGDDRFLTGPQWGTGWMWEDTYAGWGAGVSGLQLHPNRLRAGLTPGAGPGDPATFHLDEPGPPPELDVSVRTGAPGSKVRLDFLPSPEGGPVRLAGWIPADADTVPLYLATRHPTLYFLDHLAGVLRELGIQVNGSVRRAGDDEPVPAPTWDARHHSDSLGAVLPELLKPSDNQVAEVLLRTLGREAPARVEGTPGSATTGLRVVRARLEEWGIGPDAVDLTDGSGMSRYNQVTPRAVVRLLRTVWRLPHHDVFLRSLPVAAEDGTLESRLLATPAAGNLRGKTGSLSSVRALSGYVEAGDGTTLVFSLLLNGYAGPGDVAVAMEDRLVEQLALYRRPVEPGWPELRGR